MIHSRAFLLLRKELFFFQQEDQQVVINYVLTIVSVAVVCQDISVSVEDDMFHWSATIRPKDALWKGTLL